MGCCRFKSCCSDHPTSLRYGAYDAPRCTFWDQIGHIGCEAVCQNRIEQLQWVVAGSNPAAPTTRLRCATAHMTRLDAPFGIRSDTSVARPFVRIVLSNYNGLLQVQILLLRPPDFAALRRI